MTVDEILGLSEGRCPEEVAVVGRSGLGGLPGGAGL